MLQYYTALNIFVTTFACLFLDGVRTPIIVVPLAIIEFVLLKQFRIACSLANWQLFYLQQSFIPKLIPDFELLSVLLCGIGFWIGLGYETKHYEAIRPGLVIVTAVLYMVPFQTQMETWQLVLFTIWYHLLFGLSCWLKDQLEEKTTTVNYFLLTTGWVLVISPHPIFFVPRIAWTLWLLKVGYDNKLLNLPTTTTAAATPLPLTRVKRVPAKKLPKREFTFNDGFRAGMKMLREDDFISAKIYHITKQANAVDVGKELIAKDDPEVLKAQSKFTL